MMDELPTRTKPMGVSKPNWSLVFIVLVLLVLLVAGIGGVGSAQQTANATTNQSSTVARSPQATDGLRGTVISPSPVSPTVGDAPISTAEPNDNWQNATPINTENVVNGTLPVDDQDWYIFTVESSGSITVRIAASQANMSVFLYSSGGDLLARSYIHPDEQISITGRANSSGGYYVFVRNEGNRAAGYAFEVSVEQETPIPTDNSQAGNNSGGLPLSLIAAGVIIVLLGVVFIFRTADEPDSDEENGDSQNQE